MGAKKRDDKAGFRIKAWLFWVISGLLALSLAFTIIGSASDLQGLLNAGIVGWLASSSLLFAWLVLFIWSRTRRYAK